MAGKIPVRPSTRFFETIEVRSKDYQLGDEAVSNLFLIVRPSGSRRWVYDAANTVNANGRRIKLSLGNYPAFSLADARLWAEEKNGLRGRGIDPREAARDAARQQARQSANTMRAVHARYIEFKRAEGLRTIDEKVRLLTANVFPLHGDRPISSFTKADARACIQTVRDRGSNGSANRVLAELSAFLGWAASEDYVEHNVAAAILATGGSNPRRALELHELGWLWKALDRYPVDEADAIRLLILTGCRKMEACGSRLTEIRDGVWRLPRDRAKTKVECHLPLAPLARDIFNRARERALADGRACHFHAAPHSKMFGSLLDRLRADLADRAKREGMATPEPWDFHSIRHALRTHIVGDDPGNMMIAERILNHAVSGIDRRYDHNQHLGAKLKLLTEWEGRVMALVAKPLSAAA